MSGRRLFVALLRGINVGGSGLLSMKDLFGLCSKLGFQSVRTYIQSGNVLFESDLSESDIVSSLEEVLASKMRKKIHVMVRTQQEMSLVLENNPFKREEPAKVAVAFLSGALRKGFMKNVIAPGGERVLTGRREIYIHYPNGMGRSKLKLPLNDVAVTVRNINTVRKLVAMMEIRNSD
jgi:uncharacterized protein (DUF1697 family)